MFFFFYHFQGVKFKSGHLPWLDQRSPHDRCTVGCSKHSWWTVDGRRGLGRGQEGF